MMPSISQKVAPRVVEVRPVEIVFIVEVRSNDGTDAEMRAEADMHARQAAHALGVHWTSVRAERIVQSPPTFRVAVSSR